MPKRRHWQKWPELLQRSAEKSVHSLVHISQTESKENCYDTTHVHYHFTVGYRPICLHFLRSSARCSPRQAFLRSVYVPFQERSPCRRSHRRKAGVRRGIGQLKTDIYPCTKLRHFFGRVQDSKLGGIFSLHPCFWK